MRIWDRLRSALPGWPWKRSRTAAESDGPEGPAASINSEDSVRRLLETHAHLNQLLEDTSIPASVRAELAAEFEELQSISEKIGREEIHIAAFGRVGVGKSSLLNALLGRKVFRTSPLHGETREEGRSVWTAPDGGAVEGREGQVVLIDTPGIDEVGGADREAMAHRIARRSDIVMMVCEGDLVDRELRALQGLAREKRALLLVLNKADHFTARELGLLLERLRERTEGLLGPEQIVAVSADPRAGAGSEAVARAPDIAALRALLWNLLERQGKSLAALNAALFATHLDRKVATRIVEARQAVAARIVRNYCISKGLLVAANPIPIGDLLAAGGLDVAMVAHLGQVYGFRPSRTESASLLVTISAQMAALMGAYWGANLLSSLLKTASAGLSTALTAAAQGALAWYATLVAGRMAEAWFAQGKSWGSRGPRQTARDILASLDRDEVLARARDELAVRFRR